MIVALSGGERQRQAAQRPRPGAVLLVDRAAAHRRGRDLARHDQSLVFNKCGQPFTSTVLARRFRRPLIAREVWLIEQGLATSTSPRHHHPQTGLDQRPPLPRPGAVGRQTRPPNSRWGTSAPIEGLRLTGKLERTVTLPHSAHRRHQGPRGLHPGAVAGRAATDARQGPRHRRPRPDNHPSIARVRERQRDLGLSR